MQDLQTPHVRAARNGTRTARTPAEYFYYACQYNPNTPSHVAAAPDHPRTVQVREDLLQAETLRGLAAYALAPGREQRLAQLIPSTATAKKEQHDRQAAALHKRLKRLTSTQDNLMRELRGSFDMPDHAGEEYRRRIRADYATLHTEHQTITAQLAELADDPVPTNDLDLVRLLPEVAAGLDELPADLQAELFDVFGIQIVWNAPTRQATFRGRVAPVHCCTGAPSGPRMRVPAHTAQASRCGRLRSSAAPRCSPPTG